MNKVLAAFLFVSMGVAGFADMPYAKALAGAQDLVAKKPNDARARFALGRVLFVGYVSEPETLDAEFDGDGYVVFPVDAPVQLERKESEISDTAANSLRMAVTHLMRATRYNANDALYALANAWAFEQLAANWKRVMAGESLGDIASEADAWAKVAAENRRAYGMAKDRDVQEMASRAPGPNAFPSVLAAKNLLRLKESNKARVTEAEADRLRSHIAKFVS